MNGRPCGASIHFRGKLLIPPDVHAAGRDFIAIVRAAREFCRRLFVFGAGLHVSGIARLRGSRACSADGQQDCRCAVRLRVKVGAMNLLLWLAAEAASLRGCAVRLNPHGRGLAAVPHRYGGALCALDLAGGGSLFPLNNIVFAPSQKHLMRLARIKRACNLRPTAAHVRREGGGG